MTIQAILGMRRSELQRRVVALPNEVKQWQSRTAMEVDQNLHFSQLQAIGVLMDTFSKQQKDLLEQMKPEGDLSGFENASFELLKNIIRSQRVWDFFRDKLDLRFSPEFKDVLKTADIVAYDCYRPVLENAAGVGILDYAALREPPLTYLTADYSPATWVRGSRPNDGRDYSLGTSSLPIPVIQVPWDHVENTWEFMALHHEVGHDLEADFKLRPILASIMQKALLAGKVPVERIQQWLNWQGEIFADLVGLQLGGPAFAEGLMNLLMLPSAMVVTPDPIDPHPTHYPRILMNTAYIPTLAPGHQPLADHGQQIADRWISIYSAQPQFKDVLDDFQIVYPALMDTPLTELKNSTVRQLMPYNIADDLRIRKAAGFMASGKNKPAKLMPRHCISAARIAVTRAALDGTLSDDLMEKINQRTMALVNENGPAGLKGGDFSDEHTRFIASFVDKLNFN